MLEQLEETVEDIDKDFFGFCFRDDAFFFDVMTEIAKVAEFLNDVVVVLGFKHINELHDVVGVQFLHDLNFLQEAIHQVVNSGDLLSIDHFNCDCTTRFPIFAFVHIRVRPRSDELREAELVFVDLFNRSIRHFVVQ